MKKLIFLLFGLIAVLSAAAQSGLPRAYAITADTATGYIFLPDSCWQIMADPTGKMTLQEVIHSDHFKNNDKEMNYDINTYWLRYRITNSLSKEVTISVPVSATQYADMYAKTGHSQWQHFRSGTLVPWSERDGEKSLISINLTIPAGKSATVYERDIFDYKVSQLPTENVAFSFAQGTAQQQRSQYIQSLALVFLLGLILLGIVINLYFFIIVREKEFLYFALFIFFVGLTFIASLGDVFFKDHPVVQPYLGLFSVIFIYFFFIYLVRHFPKTFIHFPRWDKYLVVLSFAQGIIFLFIGFGSAIFHKNLSALSFSIRTVLTLIISLSLLITILLFIHNKDKIIRLMIFAVAPLACILIFTRILEVPYVIYYTRFGPGAIPAFILSTLQIVNILFIISQAWMIVLFACILFMRFSRLRKKIVQQEIEREKERSMLVEQQKIELEKQVTERTVELTQSLDNLKSTQKQLIQSEKMASLGELTAGIAHEIQNPLNFVNNFSEVNRELITEMKSELVKDNGQLAIDIANDIDTNEEKITYHGKRADAIVKGMLQHSRGSSGQKELTDINALADEYLRLSYHGLRAKDKSFNATMKTDFDETIGKINIVPQDIGRVLLNLINNAFYACTERSRNPQPLKESNGYVPVVAVVTKKLNGKIEIKVKDNGNGIPQKILDKIYQPFFTTKPTGEGTGLGLSLSYEIIKAQGGEIKVKTKEDEGTEFIVRLPVDH